MNQNFTGNDIIAVITVIFIICAVMWILFPANTVKKTRRDVGKVAVCLPNGSLVYKNKIITYDYAMRHQIRIEMMGVKQEKPKMRSFWKAWE